MRDDITMQGAMDELVQNIYGCVCGLERIEEEVREYAGYVCGELAGTRERMQSYLETGSDDFATARQIGLEIIEEDEEDDEY